MVFSDGICSIFSWFRSLLGASGGHGPWQILDNSFGHICLQNVIWVKNFLPILCRKIHGDRVRANPWKWGFGIEPSPLGSVISLVLRILLAFLGESKHASKFLHKPHSLWDFYDFFNKCSFQRIFLFYRMTSPKKFF